MATLMARLKHIIRGGKLISVLQDKLDDNAVETINIKDSNITTSKIADSNVTESKLRDQNVTNKKLKDNDITNQKIKDDTIEWGKVNPDVKYIADNAAICALRDVGGIKIGDAIHNEDLTTLLKAIIIPPTSPKLGQTTLTYSTQDIQISDISTSIQAGTTTSTGVDGNSIIVYVPTGSVVNIGQLVTNVMMKSDTIASISVTVTRDNNTIYEYEVPSSTINGAPLFTANTYKSFTASAGNFGAITMDGIISNIVVKVTTISNDNLTATKTITIQSRPYVFYTNMTDYSPVLDAINGLFNNSGYFDFANKLSLNAYKYGDAANSLSVTYPAKINAYSLLLLPAEGRTINQLIDQNNFTQNVTYIGTANMIYKRSNNSTVSVPYKLFVTDKCTAPIQTYKFKVV